MGKTGATEEADTAGRAWRSWLAQVFPRRILLLCGAIFLVHAALLVLLVRPLAGPELHRAPVSVVAPSVVSDELVRIADAVPGRPLAAVAASSRKAALEDLEDGFVVAALVLDLGETEDRLVLHDERDPQLNHAVEQQVREILRAHGRTLRVSHEDSSRVGLSTTARIALTTSVVGLVLAIAISFLFGPSPARLRAGVQRVASIALASLLIGTAWAWSAFDSPAAERLAIGGILAAAMLLPALLTLALGALFGLGGTAVSISAFVVLATPLLVGTDKYLLPQPWRVVVDWTPTGATRGALEAVTLFGGAGVLRPMLVLATWFLLTALVMIVARRERARSAVTLEAGLWNPRTGITTPAVGEPQREPRGRDRWWRLRVVLLTLPSAVLLAMLLTTIPLGDLPAAAPVVDKATQTRCVSTGKVDSVRALNEMSRELRGTGVFRGGDVGASALLQDGRRLLVFGDTIRQLEDGRQTFVRNSMLLLAPGCIQAVLPPDGGALIPDRPSGDGVETVGYWPMSVSVSTRPGYDLVGVTAQRVRSTGDGAFDFENLGGAVATFIVAPGRSPQLVSVNDLGPDLHDVARPTWGAASAVADGWVYMYGTASSAEEMVFGYSLHVARVRPDQVQDLRAWQYWDGDSWSRSPAEAMPLIPAQGGTSQTLSVFERDGTWYALSKRDEFLGSEVVVWSGPAPWGPFDDGRTVASLPSDVHTGQLRYMPLAHPDLLPQHDSVVISYSRNRTSVGTVLADPMQYRPRFVRVDLP